MRAGLNISIPKPCNEDWDKMNIMEQGRFCGVCSTVVTDFSDKTTEEIIELISIKKGSNCGHFHISQVQNASFSSKIYTFIESRIKWRFIRSSFVSIITLALFVSGCKSHTAVKGRFKASKQNKNTVETVKIDIENKSL